MTFSYAPGHLFIYFLFSCRNRSSLGLKFIKIHGQMAWWVSQEPGKKKDWWRRGEVRNANLHLRTARRGVESPQGRITGLMGWQLARVIPLPAWWMCESSSQGSRNEGDVGTSFVCWVSATESSEEGDYIGLLLPWRAAEFWGRVFLLLNPGPLNGSSLGTWESPWSSAVEKGLGYSSRDLRATPITCQASQMPQH